jgi:hypothetical protein
MTEGLLDTQDLSDSEYLALIEVAKLWQFKTFRAGGICRKSDMEAWLTEHYHLSSYAGHVIANRLTETFNPREFDIDLTRLAGLSDNLRLRAQLQAAEAERDSLRAAIKDHQATINQWVDRCGEARDQRLAAEADAERLYDALLLVERFEVDGLSSDSWKEINAATVAHEARKGGKP